MGGAEPVRRDYYTLRRNTVNAREGWRLVQEQSAVVRMARQADGKLGSGAGHGWRWKAAEGAERRHLLVRQRGAISAWPCMWLPGRAGVGRRGSRPSAGWGAQERRPGKQFRAEASSSGESQSVSYYAPRSRRRRHAGLHLHPGFRLPSSPIRLGLNRIAAISALKHRPPCTIVVVVVVAIVTPRP